jgi:hypothetical protein
MSDSLVLRAALRWCKRGAAPIPVRFRDKAPIGEAWQKQRITAADAAAAFAVEPVNVGILWGAPSGHLVDVDLDWAEACAVAPTLLPATAVYGRAGARGSHWLYRVEGAVTHQWTLPPALVPGERRVVVLELRAEGAQSVVPPSTHPSGELYEWEHESKPYTIRNEDLVRRLNLLAAGTVLVQFWREGARHQLALALSGAALSAGYTIDEVTSLVTGIATAAGDGEVLDRVKAAQTSAAALVAGKPATGLPRLAELVGEPTVMVLKRWLNLGSAVPAGIAAANPVTWNVGEPRIQTCAPAEIVEVPMRWLWPNRIARGKLNMIAGEPGLSKSVLTCEITAITTRGGTWPLDGTSCEPGHVLMLNVEDDPADTIKPRLMAAGAALERVQLITGVQTAEGKQRGMTLADVDLLDRHLELHRRQFALLVCDPVGALMAGADSHKDSEVRGLLAPLAALAVKHELAVLLVAHLNKATGMTALNRVVGSIGFAAAVRMLYFLVRDPDDRERLLLVPGKANLAPATMAGLSYELESADLGKGIVAPRICWHDVPEMRSANEVLNPPKQDKETPTRLEAEVWLHDRLLPGPVLVRTLQEEAPLAVDGSWRSVQRAAGRLGVVGGGEHKARTWQLPDEALRHNDIATTRHELGSCPNGAVAGPQDAALGQHPDSWRNGAMAQWRDAADAAPEQAILEVGDAAGSALHPCTACSKLNPGCFCFHYQRVLPEPATPNACIHFEQRLPDTPWE